MSEQSLDPIMRLPDDHPRVELRRQYLGELLGIDNCLESGNPDGARAHARDILRTAQMSQEAIMALIETAFDLYRREVAAVVKLSEAKMALRSLERAAAKAAEEAGDG